MEIYKRLDELCVINMGQSPDSNSYNQEEDGLPFFQGNADFGELYPVIRMWCNKPTKTVEKNTLLISVRAPIGALNFATEKSCIGRGLAGITPKEDVNIKYIFYSLKYKKDELNNKGTGSTFKAIAKGALGEIKMKSLSFGDQTYCVEVLDKTTALISRCKEQLVLLDNLIKSRFVEMFGDPKDNSKKWPVHGLADLCKVGSSKRIYQREQTTEGIPFLRISDLMQRIENGSEECDLYISIEKFEDLKAKNLVPIEGDILVTSRGTLGKCYIMKDTDYFYFQDGMISWLYDIDKSITPVYISYLFGMKGIRKQIDSLQGGSTVAYLSISMMKKLKIMLPPINLQNQFATFVHQVDKLKFEIQKSLDETQILMDSLMQQYFS